MAFHDLCTNASVIIRVSDAMQAGHLPPINVKTYKEQARLFNDIPVAVGLGYFPQSLDFFSPPPDRLVILDKMFQVIVSLARLSLLEGGPQCVTQFLEIAERLSHMMPVIFMESPHPKAGAMRAIFADWIADSLALLPSRPVDMSVFDSQCQEYLRHIQESFADMLTCRTTKVGTGPTLIEAIAALSLDE